MTHHRPAGHDHAAMMADPGHAKTMEANMRRRFWVALTLTLIGYPTAYYEAAAMLVTFVLFGHWMEMKARRGTSDALRALFDLVPPAD